MSKPRERWWSFAKNMIRDYPMLCKSMDDIHQQNVTASMTGMPRGGGGGRTVEAISLRQLEDPSDQEAYDTVARAIQITRGYKDGNERLKLIELMYWGRKPMAMKYAMLQLNISESTAKRWHRAFVQLVGKCYGLKSRTPRA